MGPCGGAAGVGKSSLCDYHGKDWVRSGPSMEAKARRKL